MSPRSQGLPRPRDRKAFAVVIVGPLCLATAWLSYEFIRRDRSPTPHDLESGVRTNLVARPERIDLGVLPPGSVRTATAELDNRGGEAVVVALVKSSCPCVTATAGPSRIAPKGRGQLSVTFDPNGEPDFRGRLSVVLEGIDEGGLELFEVLVDLNVIDKPRSVGAVGENQEARR